MPAEPLTLHVPDEPVADQASQVVPLQTAVSSPTADQTILGELRRIRSLLEAGAAELLDAAGTARLLGISEPSLYRLRSAGRVPAPLKLSSGLTRWRTSELREWIRAGCPDRRTWQTMQRK